MLLKRRKPPTLAERVRTWLWPRRCWERSFRYFLLRLQRLQSTPHQIALGCALGVFASITPLFGAQMLLAGVLATLARASVPAALIGTFFGNPLSWPAIWVATYAAGCQMLGIEILLHRVDLARELAPLSSAVLHRSPQMLETAMGLVWPVLKPMLAGSLPLGLAFAAVTYYGSRRVVRSYQSARAGRTGCTS